MGEQRVTRRQHIAFAVFATVALVLGGLLWWASPGDAIAVIDVRSGPGRSPPLDLARGDEIRITLDCDVSFRWSGGRQNARPQGCRLELVLADDRGAEAGRASCPLADGDFAAVGGSVETSETGGGIVRQKHEAFWTTCRFVVPSAGRYTATAHTNLGECVDAVHTAILHVHREAR